MILRIGGVPLHVRREGSGPVCVLCGGLGGSWFDWDPVVPLLTPYRTVLRFDRPGYGLSAPSPAAPTAAGEAERIRLILDALGIRDRCTMVGHSLAAFHVEAFARLHPDRVAGLVLLDGSTEPDPHPLPGPVLRDRSAGVLAGALTACAVPYLLGPTARRLTARATTVLRTDLAPLALVRRCYRPGRALRTFLRENVHYLDVAAELAELRRRAPMPSVPVTAVAAVRHRHSWRARRWVRRQGELAALLGAEVRICSPSGHLLMFDRPADVASAVLEQGEAPRPVGEGPR
jgi:pimeloyl-ACP methyl ester carboxylesterase